MAMPIHHGDVKLGDWKKQSVLGSGGFGQVSLWLNVVTQEKIAIKVSKLQSQDKSFIRWKQEVKIMQELHHESIVNFQKVPEIIQKHFVGCSVALGMEYCELGDLRRMLGQPKNCCGLPEFQVRDFLSNIGSAIHFLHKKAIIHRDIKPENIVMKSINKDKIQYKIIDLGYAKDLNEYSCGTSFVGTIHYLAPEFSTTQALRYTKTVDFWSFGLVAFECITGRRPFYPHVENVMQFLSTLREKKKDEDICTADDEGPNPEFLFYIPQPHSLNSVLAQKLGVWLQSMLMLDPALRGGGDSESGWYEKLKEILSEKHVQVFNTLTNSIVALPADAGLTIWTFKDKLLKETKVPVEQQLLLFPDGDEPHIQKRVVDQCWKEASSSSWKTFLFSYDMGTQLHKVEIPNKILNLGKTSSTVQGTRAIRRTLCLATNFINSQCRLCEQILAALFALQKGVEKRYLFFCGCINDLKKYSYSLQGQIDLCREILHRDTQELENLLQKKEYEAGQGEWLDKWQGDGEKLDEFQESIFSPIEKFLTCERQFSNVLYLTKKAETFASTTMTTLSEIVKVCYQRHDAIRSIVRKLHENERRPRPAKDASSADSGPDLQKSLEDLLRNFILPTVKEISKFIKEARSQIPDLLKVVHSLPQYVMESNNLKTRVISASQSIREDQFTRQQALWDLTKYYQSELFEIHSQFYDAFQRMGEVNKPQDEVENLPSGRFADAMLSQQNRFTDLMKNIQEETSLRDLLHLDWTTLQSSPSSEYQNCSHSLAQNATISQKELSNVNAQQAAENG